MDDIIITTHALERFKVRYQLYIQKEGAFPNYEKLLHKYIDRALKSKPIKKTFYSYLREKTKHPHTSEKYEFNGFVFIFKRATEKNKKVLITVYQKKYHEIK